MKILFWFDSICAVIASIISIRGFFVLYRDKLTYLSANISAYNLADGMKSFGGAAALLLALSACAIKPLYPPILNYVAIILNLVAAGLAGIVAVFSISSFADVQTGHYGWQDILLLVSFPVASILCSVNAWAAWRSLRLAESFM